MWLEIVATESFIINAADYVQVLRSGCELNGNVAVSCSGGNSVTLPGTLGFAFYGVQPGGYWSKKQQNVGPMSQVDHEYTHNVQFAQWNGVSDARALAAHRVMPCWWQEGQANAIGIPVWAPSSKVYSSARDGNVTRAINPDGPRPILKDYSAKSFTAFLDQDPNSCYHPGSNGDYQLGYSVGYAAVEALVAIAGPQATMAVLARTASGDTWEQAFQAVYDVPWSEALNCLGNVLAAEYKAKPFQK